MEKLNLQNELEDIVLPFGMRFNPTNSELVVHYLKRKIIGQQLPAAVIPTVDVFYTSPENLPFSLFKYGKPNEWYFFTYRKKGKILTKGGYYEVSAHEAIYDKIGSRRELVGFLRTLDFYYGKSPAGTRSQWSVHEFKVNPGTIEVKEDDHVTPKMVSNIVVCKVVNNMPTL